jgi:hypothetical protein
VAAQLAVSQERLSFMNDDDVREITDWISGIVTGNSYRRELPVISTVVQNSS